MNNYNINFEGKNNSLSKSLIYQYPCFKIFDNYEGQKIRMYRFVGELYNNGWTVEEKVINSDDTIFRCYSSQFNVRLNIKLSTNSLFIQENMQEFNSALKILEEMSKNAKIVNNKIVNINDYRKESFSKNCKNIKIYPTSKELLRKRAKIVLATLAIATTAVFTVCGVVNAIETQKEIDKNKEFQSNNYSYSQNYNPSPVEGVSQEVFDKSIESYKNMNR